MTKEKEAALSGNRAMSQERQQLDKAQHGLEAAAMLSEQLDKKSSVISRMKQETSVTWSYCVDVAIIIKRELVEVIKYPCCLGN